MTKQTYINKNFNNQTLSNAQGLGGGSNQVYEVADITARDAIASPNTADIAKVADDGTGNPRDYIWSGSAWVAFVGSASIGENNSNALLIDLEAYYKFEESSGDRLNSVNAANHILSPTSGTIATNAGINNQGLELSDAVLKTAAPIIALNQDFSVAGWVKVNALNFYNAIAQFATESPFAQFLYLGTEGNGSLNPNKFSFLTRFENADQVSIVSTTASVIGVWNFIVATYEQSSKLMKLYVNATEEGSQIRTIDPGIAGVTSVGNLAAGSNNQNCTIDELGFWTRVLEQAEINELYNNGNGKFYDDFGVSIDGNGGSTADSISVSATPTNYSPTAANVEDHLSAIDQALASGGGGGNSGSTRIFDSFTDTDGTSIASHVSDLDTNNSNWEEVVQLGSTILITNSVTIQNNSWSSSSDSHGSVKDTGSTDVVISACWHPQTGVFNRNSLVARYTDADNCLIANFREDNGDFQIVSIVSGNSVTLANKTIAIAEGEVYSISLKAFGGFLEANVTQKNVGNIISETITAITTENLAATKHGIMRNTGDSTTIVDSFSLISVGAAGTQAALEIAVSATPTNYSPTAANVEEHLSAIDLALASGGGGGLTTIEEVYQHNSPFAVSGSTTNTISFDLAALGGESLFDKSTGSVLQDGFYFIELSSQIRNPAAPLNSSIEEIGLTLAVNGAGVAFGGMQSWNNTGYNGAGSSVSFAGNLTTSDILSFLIFIWDGSQANSYELEANSYRSQLKIILLSGSSSSGAGRESLTSDRTYYVSPTGSDSSDGLTTGTAFLTIQKAIDVVASLDWGGIYQPIIQLADGIYDGKITALEAVGCQCVTIQGNNTTPSSVTLDFTSATNIDGVINALTSLVTKYVLKDFKLQNTSSQGYGINSQGSNIIDFQNLVFDNAPQAQIVIGAGGVVKAIGDYAIEGGGTEHIACFDGGFFRNSSAITITISNNPAIANFLVASRGGQILLVDANYSGAINGSEYLINQQSRIVRAGTVTLPNATTGTVDAASFGVIV